MYYWGSAVLKHFCVWFPDILPFNYLHPLLMVITFNCHVTLVYGDYIHLVNKVMLQACNLSGTLWI